MMKLSSAEIIGLLAVALIIGLGSGLMIAGQETTINIPSVSSATGPISEAHTKLVAVTRDGDGIVTDLSVKTVPGTGRVLVDIDNLLFFLDTQQSMQTARAVAEGYLNVSLKDRDLVYAIHVPNTSAVGGESAGGALTIATIAALSGRQLREDTIMTGTINPDGTVGQIGGLLAKAKAADEAGFRYFLVPEGQGTYTVVQREQNCSRVGKTVVCETRFRPIKISIGNETGITIIEVATIDDVAKYFFSKGSV